MKSEEKNISPYKWAKLRNPLRSLMNGFICEICKCVPSVRLKNLLYRAIGVKIGEKVVIAPHVQLDPFFPEKIKIGDGSVLGWGTKVFTHAFDTEKVKKGEVKIGENCLIGAGSIIMPGNEIGDGAIVGAETFVNKDVKENEEVGGVPEHHIKYKKKEE